MPTNCFGGFYGLLCFQQTADYSLWDFHKEADQLITLLIYFHL